VIVVVGTPAWREADPAGPDGRACLIALAAARRGAGVELVGRAGEDRAGDALMVALARVGVGHVALLRDPTRPTPIVAPALEAPSLLDDDGEEPARPSSDGPILEPADVSLGLRYLPSYDVIVVSDDVDPTIVAVAGEAAAFGDAHLVVLVPAGGAAADGAAGATVLEAPVTDPDGAFADLVGSYAAALDAGSDPAAAFAAVRGAWERPGA
jgi:bifunctional ADP-heptose synthase (sugar kinase/adenylyltransferase)